MIKHTKINLDIDVKVYLREKKGYFYAVLIYKNVAGIRREKSGIRLPDEYKCIVDNEILHSDFIEEAVADLEDMLYDLE